MDNDILDSLYEKYYKEVYRYIFAMCKDHHQTESLVSDTFYKALLSVNDDEKHMKYWLFKVAKNLWLDLLRQKKNDTLDDIQLEDNQLGPLDRILEQEENRKLYAAMDSLPKRYKKVLMQYYFYDYSLKMIAKEGNMGPGAARTLLYRARLKLKECMKDVK